MVPSDVLDELMTLFEIMTEREALEWLFVEHPSIGRVPARALLKGDTDEVLALIDQLGSGAYV